MLRTVSLDSEVSTIDEYSLAGNNHWASFLRRRPLHPVRDRRLKADGLVDYGLQELEVNELVRVDVYVVSSTFARGCVDFIPESAEVAGILDEIEDHVCQCRTCCIRPSDDSKAGLRSKCSCIHRRVGFCSLLLS
jgi:hypothetical protein